MRADINMHGALTLRAETELESYALRNWCEEHFDERAEVVDTEKLVFDFNPVDDKRGDT